MPPTAVVLVGNSHRFPKKHLKYVGKRRLIDLVVKNLKNIGFDVVVYSKYEFSISVPIIIDEEPWILPSLVYLLKKIAKGIFIFGGDMPLIQREAVKKMMPHLSHAVVVPKWKNGYLEPLHAYYTPKIISLLEEVMVSEKPSLHSAIRKCRDAYYLEAENMPKLTFFNVNTPEDFEALKNILEHTKVF